MSEQQLESLLREVLRRVTEEREYLTIDDVADRLKCDRKTILNRISAGIFREGVHYFRPEGVKTKGKNKGNVWHCDPLFKWSAVVAWVEGAETAPNSTEQAKAEKPGVIPMRKGYSL